MIDTTKPVRFYDSKLPEKGRIYFTMDQIQSESLHTCTCNIIGEPETFIIINKVNSTILNPNYKGWIVENYEIPNFPEPEIKFTNVVTPLEVNIDLLAEWQKEKLTSQIQAWTLENDPLREERIYKNKNFFKKISETLKGQAPQAPKKIPEQYVRFVEEYWKQYLFVRDCFNESSLTRIDKDVKTIDVVSTVVSNFITLPVYRVIFKNGIEMMFYCDFNNYFISILSQTPINIEMELLGNPSQRLFHADCPGFKPEWIFAPYTENRKQFTTFINCSDNIFFTFLFMLHLQLKIK